MRIAKVLSAVLIVVFAIGLIGCGKSDTPDGGGTVATVNGKCPVMGGTFNQAKVAPELVRDFSGKKVGFCCAGCLPKWDALSDEDKTAKLAAVTTP
ncbi:MAG: hypothetical protein QGH60_04270 [Phycisphaerae bacterium]|jgi:hypothetical protein|nr:hypothetical protein [Phycisphaerae bacterium]